MVYSIMERKQACAIICSACERVLFLRNLCKNRLGVLPMRSVL
jgi:hypothetical protein